MSDINSQEYKDQVLISYYNTFIREIGDYRYIGDNSEDLPPNRGISHNYQCFHKYITLDEYHCIKSGNNPKELMAYSLETIQEYFDKEI